MDWWQEFSVGGVAGLADCLGRDLVSRIQEQPSGMVAFAADALVGQGSFSQTAAWTLLVLGGLVWGRLYVFLGAPAAPGSTSAAVQR